MFIAKCLEEEGSVTLVIMLLVNLESNSNSQSFIQFGGCHKDDLAKITHCLPKTNT